MSSNMVSAVALLWLLIILTFFPVLSADYVAYDEQHDVLANPLINSDFSFHGLLKIFGSFEKSSNQYTPLSVASFWLERNIFGLDSSISHLVNLFLHLGVAAAVFFVGLRLSGNAFTGWLAALIWAIHPMQVETVAWVLERRNLLYALFLFLSVAFYLEFCRDGRSLWLNLATVAFVFSGLAKTLAFFIPFLWLMIDWLEQRQIGFQLLKEKKAAVALAICFLLLMFTGAHDGIGKPAGKMLDWNLAAFAMSFYVAKAIFPAELSPVMEITGRIESRLVFGPLFFIVTAFVLLLLARSSRLAKFGLAFYFFQILPLSGLVRVGMRFYAACHFMYVALFGLVLVGVGAVTTGLSGKKSRNVLMVTVFVFTASLGWISQQNCLVWQNTASLYEYALSIDPEGEFARANLAAFYYRRKDFLRAAENYEYLIKKIPGKFDYYNNLAVAYYDAEKPDMARKIYEEILIRFPTRFEGYSGLAVVNAASGRFFEAIRLYDRALSLAPGKTDLLYNRGLAKMNVQDLEGAAADFSSVLHIQPDYVPAVLMRSETVRKMGNYDLALADGYRLIARFPDNLPARIRVFEIHCEAADIAGALLLIVDSCRSYRFSDKEKSDLASMYLTGPFDFIPALFPFKSWISYLVR